MTMQLPCSRIQAVFAAAPVKLENHTPVPLLLDEHGGTYVLRVAGLHVLEWPEPPPQSGVFLEIALPGDGSWRGAAQEFASRHSLPLTTWAPPPEELLEQPLLSACHVPEKTLFIFCEDSLLRLRAPTPQTLELTVTGPFTSRRLPSRETDLIIQLAPPAVARVLSFLLSLSREPR